jgi:hypothetical protein
MAAVSSALYFFENDGHLPLCPAPYHEGHVRTPNLELQKAQASSPSSASRPWH